MRQRDMHADLAIDRVDRVRCPALRVGRRAERDAYGPL